MSLPTTLSDITNYINGLESFPVDRTKQVFYGYSDTNQTVYVAFGGLHSEPQYTTAGPFNWHSKFEVHVYHTSNQDALTLAGEVDDLLSLQKVTPKTMLCILESLDVAQEDLYRFHVQLTYDLQEGA